MKQRLKRAASSAFVRAFLILAAAVALAVWAFLSAFEPSMRQTLEGHRKSVRAIAYSPDGTQLASGSWDNDICIWDLKTGETIRTLKGHTDAVRTVAFSPDGKRLASGSSDNTIRIWNAETGEAIRTLEGHTNAVVTVAYSPNGMQLASSGRNEGTIRIWNPDTGEPQQTFDSGRRSALYSISYSPDGVKLAAAYGDKKIRIWDAKTGALLKTLTGHANHVECVAYSPDGTKLVSVSPTGNKRIHIWDAETGAFLRTLKRFLHSAAMVAFSPDGKMLAGAGKDRTIRVWEFFSGEILQTYTTDGSVLSIAFSPDGAALASSSRRLRGKDAVQIWDAPSAPAGASVRIEGEREHGAGAFDVSIVFSESMKSFERSDIQVENGSVTAFSGSGDSYTAAIQPSGIHTARVWIPKKAAGNHGRSNTFAFYPALRTAMEENEYFRAAAFSPDGSMLASAGAFSKVRIRELATGKTQRRLDSDGQLRIGRKYSGVNSILYSPDGSMLAVGNIDILIWDAADFKKLHTLKRRAEETVLSIAFSPDSAILASGGDDGTVRIWNPITGELLRTFTGRPSEVQPVAFSPDGTKLASCARRTIHIMNVKTGEELRTIQMQFGRAEAVVFSPDGSMLAGGGQDDVVRIWSVETGEELRTLTGHTGAVTCAAFSPDGAILASGSRDGTVRIWNPTTGETLQMLEGHLGWIGSVVFSPDGSQLAVLNYDLERAICIWDIVPSPDL